LDTLQKLVYTEEIKSLKSRYFRLMDSKQWQEWRGLFCDDASFQIEGLSIDPGGTEPSEFQGADEFVAMAVRSLDQGVSVHQGYSPEIEILSDTEARGVWGMFDWSDTTVDGASVEFRGYGHYHDEFRREDGQWRISRLMITRIRIDFERPT
jgi:hypothetical protein